VLEGEEAEAEGALVEGVAAAAVPAAAATVPAAAAAVVVTHSQRNLTRGWLNVKRVENERLKTKKQNWAKKNKFFRLPLLRSRGFRIAHLHMR